MNVLNKQVPFQSEQRHEKVAGILGLVEPTVEAPSNRPHEQ